MGPAKFQRTSARDVIQVFFKRKVQILLFATATIVTTALLTYCSQPTYRASARVIVKAGRENIYLPATGGAKPIVTFDREEVINSELEILKSRLLFGRVVEQVGHDLIVPTSPNDRTGIMERLTDITLFSRGDQPAAGDDPNTAAIEFLAGAVSAEGVKKSNVIELGLEHSDPRVAATVLNALIQQYLNRHLEVHRSPHTHQFFQTQSGVLMHQLQQAEGMLETLRKQYSITDLAAQQSILLREIANLGTDINQTTNQKLATRKRVGFLDKELRSTPQRINLGVETDNYQALISSLEARLIELRLRERELSSKYVDNHLLVGNIREEIAIVEEKLTAYNRKILRKRRAGVNTVHQRIQEALVSHQAELIGLDVKLENQKSQLGRYEMQLNELNRVQTQLISLQREADRHRDNYELYLRKFEESRISAQMDADNIASVKLLESASIPTHPVKPRKKLNLAVGVVVGIFGALALALTSEYLDDRLDKTEAIEAAFELPVLATFPELECI